VSVHHCFPRKAELTPDYRSEICGEMRILESVRFACSAFVSPDGSSDAKGDGKEDQEDEDEEPDHSQRDAERLGLGPRVPARRRVGDVWPGQTRTANAAAKAESISFFGSEMLRGRYMVLLPLPVLTPFPRHASSPARPHSMGWPWRSPPAGEGRWTHQLLQRLRVAI